jgi:hypothetical protein
MSSTAWLTSLALAVGACRIHTPDFDGTDFLCSEDEPDCPPGQRCSGEGMCVDLVDAGAADDAPGGDAADLCAPADNDACGDAIDVTDQALAGVTLRGDTTGYANDLSPSILPGCTESPEPGPDAIYSIAGLAGDQLQVTLTPDGWNSAVYLIDGCSGTAACLGGDDAPGTGIEEATIAIGAADTYYLIVDSSAAAGAGCYELELTLIR